MNIKEIYDNAWDIGIVVLEGIKLTPTLLAKQKEAIASAKAAIARIGERNKGPKSRRTG